MIYNTINEKIATLMKGGQKQELELWRAIKTEMSNAQHAGVDVTIEANEKKVLQSMSAKRRKAADEFAKSNEPKAVAMKEQNIWEAKYLDDLAGVEPPTDPEEVRKETNCVLKTFVELKTIEDPNFSTKMIQRYTKDIIAKVKEKYPNAENSVIAGCVQAYAKS